MARPLTVRIVGDTSGLSKSLDAVGDQVGGLAKTVGKAAGAAALAGGAVIAAGVGKGFVDALNFDAANDKLAASLDLTSDQAAAFGRASAEIYGGAWGDSLDEVNGALSLVQRNIGDSLGPADDALVDATTQALDFAKALEQDIGITSQAVGRLVKTGLARDVDDAFDIMTAGVTGGADSAGDLVETFQEYSTTLRDVGLSGADAIGLFTQGLDAGARSTDVVADALKEFAIRGQDASEASAAGFEAIGLNAEAMTATIAEGGAGAREALGDVLDRLREMEDPVARNQAAVALFGTKAEDLGDALFSLDLDTVTEGFENMEGASERLGRNLNDNLSTRWEAFKRRGLLGFAKFADQHMLPAAERILDVLSRELPPIVDNVRRWFERVWPDVRRAIANVADWLVSEAWPRISTVLAAFVEAARGVADWFVANWPAIRTAIAGVFDWLAVEAWPVVAEVLEALRVGAAAVADWFVENWPAIREAIAGVFDWLVNEAWPVVAEVLGFIVEEAGKVVDWIVENWPMIQDAIDNVMTAIAAIIGAVLATIRAAWDVFGDYILDAVDVVWSGIQGVISSVMEIIRGVIQTVVALIAGDWGAAWEGIKMTVDGVWEGIKAIVSGALGLIEIAIGAAWDGITSAASAIWDAILERVESVFDDVVDAVRGLPDRILEFLGDLASAGLELAASFVAGLGDGFDSIGEIAGDIADGILGAFKDGWNTAAMAINDFIPNKVAIPFAPDIDLPDNPVPTFHDGGPVGNFGGIRREVPALLETGEYVLSRDDVAALRSGQAGAGSPLVHIERADMRGEGDAESLAGALNMQMRAA